MYFVSVHTLLGNHVLVTRHDVQTVILAVENLLEVVIDRVSIAETVTAGSSQADSRHVLIVNRRYVLNIIGGQTPKALVVVVVVVITKLCAEFQVLIDFPSESTSNIQVLTLLLLVVVIL